MAHRVWALDCETDPFLYGREPKPFVWGIYTGEEFLYFWGDDCTEQLIEYLKDENDLLLYAHNGGKFDYFFLLDYLDDELFIINGRVSKATLFDKNIELRDSYLILPLPLAANDKQEDFDYTKLERENREREKTPIIEYLKRDCVSLYNWVNDFRERFGNGLTLAGSAFKQLKSTGYEIKNTFDDYDYMFRNFYFGGRVQCFAVGAFTGNFEYVDINSAYPYAMKFKHWHGSQFKELSFLPDGLSHGSWFAEINAKSYGALPFKGDDGKLYFPDDGKERKFFASGWEIDTGIKTGTLEVTKVYRAYVPILTEDFTSYVNKFFAMKLEAEKNNDKTGRQFAKLMLNSAYGKFGQDGRKYEKFCIHEKGTMPEGDDWELYSTEANHWIFSRPDPSDRFFNVATAASVTGFVRAFLWEAINNCENPLYCDTDSIICSKFNGALSDKLGDWDLEAEASEVYIAQRKMYAMKLKNGETKTASKGVRLDFDQIREGVLTGKSITTQRDAPAFSLRYGARFIERETDFENIEKNACNNPD